MAISSGTNPHRAWLSVNGTQFPIITGSCVQEGTRKSSQFHAIVPLNYPGAAAALAALGDNSSGVIVLSNGKQAPLVMGEIDNTNFHYGFPGTIAVTGRDNSVRLHNKIHHGKFVNHTTVTIVQEMAAEAGLSVVVTGSSGIMVGRELEDEFVDMVDGESLAAIISKCAELDNARWFVDNNSVLHYEINPQASGGYSVTYKAGMPESADFFDLSIDRNVQAGKTIKVFLKSWHEENKENSGDAEATVQGRGGPVEYEVTLPNIEQNQAQKYAQNKANEIARHELTVKAHCVGDVTVTVDSGLQVNGTTYWDQTYIIDQIHHQFGMQGHTMTITARNGLGGRGSG